ncbi:uncharacterized protein PAC_02449 [Phialocephala subalpina]|uniref:2EXR domain-containing protein n=1 Tax=Phialocephala subalpina TaxID=576137 RepID=A0A1L7WIH1_9HELO|nr:uncharacterized protein PAC_02449 [Phialocephala subalpina]
MHQPKGFDPPWINFFTRPCPYYITQHTTFPKFSLLPKELQLLIWSFAMEDPRTILLIAEDVEDDGVTTLYTATLSHTPPGTLAATYDARAAALKIYRPVFTAFSSKPLAAVYFRADDEDRLEINLDMLDVLASYAESIPFEKNDMPLLKMLTVHMEDQVFERDDLVDICKYFSGLTHLQIIQKPPYDTDNNDIPHTYHLEATPTPTTWPPVRTSTAWQTLQQDVKAPIDFVRPKLKEWKPPILIVGTWLQWNGLEAKLRAKQLMVEEMEKAMRGDMEWEPTAIMPSLEYVPMYQDEKPKALYTIGIEQEDDQRRRLAMLAESKSHSDSNSNMAVVEEEL